MRSLALISLFVLAACSGGTPEAPPGTLAGPASTLSLSLKNESTSAIVYVAAGEGTLALLDLRPTLLSNEYEGRLVPPAATTSVRDIIGYDPSLGVTFHIYQVDPRTGLAHYAGYFLAGATELVRNDGLVVYDPFRF